MPVTTTTPPGGPNLSATLTPAGILITNSQGNDALITLAMINSLLIQPTTFANLPASPVDGQRGYITNSIVAASGNYGSSTTGGGSNHVPVVYNSSQSQWLIG